ncbi:NLRC3 [Symbiodinium sp. KB8]|nr:NLRC3 [Symbiodinium sp. KB8]
MIRAPSWKSGRLRRILRSLAARIRNRIHAGDRNVQDLRWSEKAILRSLRQWSAVYAQEGMEGSEGENEDVDMPHVLEEPNTGSLGAPGDGAVEQPGWCKWAGPPLRASVDMEGGFQGHEFWHEVGKAGTSLSAIGGTAHWQQGKIERHNQTIKDMLHKTIRHTQPKGREEMRKLAREVAWAKNSLVREHGWSPVSLVFGREPRVYGELHQGGNPASYHPSVGDPASDVASRMRFRYHAKMEFVRSQARQMLLRTAHNRTRRLPVPKIGQLVFFWRAENHRKTDSQSKWVGPGYVVGIQDRNAWVACGGRCFLVAGEHVREAIGDEQHYGDPELQKALALFKKIPSEATYEDLIGQADAIEEPGAVEQEPLVHDVAEDMDVDPLVDSNLPDEYVKLKSSIGWHVDSQSNPVLVSHKAWAYRSPESRYSAERFPWRTSWGFIGGEWKRLEFEVKWMELEDHHQFIPGGPASILITVFQSRTRKDACLDDVPTSVKRRKAGQAPHPTHAVVHGSNKTQSKNKLKRMMEKEIPFDMIPSSERELYRAAEEKEWQSWFDYNSCEVLSLEDSKRIERERPDRVLPSRYVFRNKNAGLKDPKGEPLPVKAKVAKEQSGVSYCGKEIKVCQHGAEQCVTLSQNAFLDGRLQPMIIERARSSDHDLRANQTELTDYRSVVGSLQWLGVQSRPDLAFECNQLQKRVADLRIRDLHRANRAVKDALKNRFEILFRPLGVDAELVTFHDAGLYSSLGVEIEDREIEDILQAGNERKLIYSQKGVCVGFVRKGATASEDRAHYNLIDWKSSTNRRVVESSFASETHAALMGHSMSRFAQVLLSEIRYGSEVIASVEDDGWQDLAPVTLITDCKSIYDTVHKDGQHVGEKGNIVHAVLLRQLLSTRGEGSKAKLMWVPTRCQVADGLTKGGPEWFPEGRSPAATREERAEDQGFGSVLEREAAFNAFLVPERKRRSPRRTHGAGSGVPFIRICQWPSQAQYGLTDPKSLAEYLNHANIRLVRAECSYLYELLKSKSLLPRRQEADPEEWGLVTHAEVRAWAAGTRDAMICSVSHAWESREHPDPCGFQLKCLVHVVSLFDAAYFSDVWLFYDYVSLFQFKRESDAEEESFRRSMQDMHVLYAHQCTRTFRIENLTPDDVWEAASKNSEYRVRVYDASSAVVRDRPLKELVANRVPYRNRGWCKAEVEWSSARSHSEQNHWIDAPGEFQDRKLRCLNQPELLGKVPMAPEIFAEEMNSAAFTHRSDAEEVKKLQFKVFLQKVSECGEALFARLPEGQLGRLAKALPYFQKLRVLRLRDFEVGRAEAGEFAKALAPNKAIRELEIRFPSRFRVQPEHGFLWEAIAEALRTNSTLTSINLRGNNIGDEGAEAIAEALKTNSTLTRIQLAFNSIGSEGGKAICEALKSNSTLTSINLEGNVISLQVLAEIEKRCRLERFEDSRAAPEAAKAWTGRVRIEDLAERLNEHCNPSKLSLSRFGRRQRGLKAVEEVKAISEALKSNSTLTSIDLTEWFIGDKGAQAIGEALKTNSTLTSINLQGNDIGGEGAEALAEALKSNATVRGILLCGNDIPRECKQALAEATGKRCSGPVGQARFHIILNPTPYAVLSRPPEGRSPAATRGGGSRGGRQIEEDQGYDSHNIPGIGVSARLGRLVCRITELRFTDLPANLVPVLASFDTDVGEHHKAPSDGMGSPFPGCFQWLSRPRAEAPIAEVPESPSSTSAQYGLTDPKSLAEYLNHANIRLIRAEYLYELLKSKSLLPRRQEAEEWGLVTHAEVKAWAAGTRDAMICSVSHAWESREHPDPCAHQLKCLVDVVSLFDAAYFSDVWLFYDYVSLFQFKRESDAEEESFRRSMQDMHVLYAHQCTRTFRIENLTPDDVWEAASKNSKYRVRVYDASSAVVRDRPLKDLVANRVPYGTRGWCKAEVEWSSARSHSEQNHWIDAPESQDNEEFWLLHMQEPELLGKVPMAPEIFAKEMNSAAFTHRSDAAEVKKLQFKVFLQKVSECEEALFEYLPEGQLRQLAKALPYFKKLRVLRLRDLKVGRAEAGEFAQALARNEAIRELEIRLLQFSGHGFLWEAIAEALRSNSTLTSIDLAVCGIGDEGCKAIGEALKTNSTLTRIELAYNRIGNEGGKAIAEALRSNSTLTSISLNGNFISKQVLAEIEKRLGQGGCAQRTGAEPAIRHRGSRVPLTRQALAEQLSVHCNPSKLSLVRRGLNVEEVKAIGEALKTNSKVTSINLAEIGIGVEGGKAICEALKCNSTLTFIDLGDCRIGDEGAEAIIEALKSNSTLTDINLAKTGIGEGGVKAICKALKSNSTLTHINLSYNSFGDEGAEAIAEALKSNSTLTTIQLAFNSIGVEGGKALAEALKSNTTVCEIGLFRNNIPRECKQGNLDEDHEEAPQAGSIYDLRTQPKCGLNELKSFGMRVSVGVWMLGSETALMFRVPPLPACFRRRCDAQLVLAATEQRLLGFVGSASLPRCGEGGRQIEEGQGFGSILEPEVAMPPFTCPCQ